MILLKTIVPRFQWVAVSCRKIQSLESRFYGGVGMAEAIREHEGMLELCPNDNPGMRHGLLGLYLKEKPLDDAVRLLREYKEERLYSAVMAWGYVMKRVLSGKVNKAKEALSAARDVNGYVEAYLKGHRKLPHESAGCYTRGSREEGDTDLR